MAGSTVDPVAASRPTTAGFGKSTESLKTMVPLEVKEDFVRQARFLGYPSDSDALRELVMLFTYGPEQLRKVHTDRIDGVARNLAGVLVDGYK